MSHRSRRRLSEEVVEAMRRLVTETDETFEAIGKQCGVAPSTAHRYAQENGWTRPPAAPPSWRRAAGIENDGSSRVSPFPSPDHQRSPAARKQAIIERLWQAAEAHAVSLARPARGNRRGAARELQDLVKALQHLSTLAPPAARPDDVCYGPSTFEETNALLEELARRYSAFMEADAEVSSA
jgi:transposase-like protein